MNGPPFSSLSLSPHLRLSPRKNKEGSGSGKKGASQEGDSILKCGWMNKQGHFRKNWRKRYFVLTAREIGYYAHETWDSSNPGKGLKGCISLYGAVVDTLADKPALKLLSGKKDRSNCLYIVGRSGEKDFVIEAEDRMEAEEWAQQIRYAIHGCNDRKIRMSFDASTMEAKTGFRGQQKSVEKEVRDDCVRPPKKLVIVHRTTNWDELLLFHLEKISQ